MKEADRVIVTDTGSEDATAEKLREEGAVVFEEKITPWRFDNARNLSLRHVPEDVDICVCTDLDEAFEPGWRAKLEESWTAGTNMARYVYNWRLKDDGSPDIQFHYFKIHDRQHYIWKYPVHECLYYIGKERERSIFIPGIVLNHRPDPGKSRGSYLNLLKMGVKEMPADTRMRYYLGREYFYKEMWEKCISALQAYLQLPSAVWAEERSAAMRWIAGATGKTGGPKEAYRWYLRAAAECPTMREPLVECAKAAYLQEDWETVFYMTHRALQIKEKSMGFVNMGYCWDHTPDDLAALACYHLKMYDRALEHARAALASSPRDERLRNNVRIIEELCKNKEFYTE